MIFFDEFIFFAMNREISTTDTRVSIVRRFMRKPQTAVSVVEEVEPTDVSETDLEVFFFGKTIN